MSVFVLVPGAGGATWYWNRVVPELRTRGHEAATIDLPGPDESAGLPEYADAVTAAISEHDDVVVVAQSMAGFSAPVACARAHVGLLVLVNAMIPLPGETPGQWWGNTGAERARIAAADAGGYSAEFDPQTYFLHDVSAELVEANAAEDRAEADIAFGQPCDIERWPDVPTRVLVGREDRFFPAEFQRRVARERLGIAADEVPGGHLVALSHPLDLVDRLAYSVA